MKLVNLIQNSDEWMAWRNEGVGASEIPALVGNCPWKTKYDVWLTKTKRKKAFDNMFTRHGKETEAKARARYELVSMSDMRIDVCAVHPKYEICRASLDGLSSDGKLILELKCPISRMTLDEALKNKVPDHYADQIQFQLAVTGADEADFFVYHEESNEHALVKVLPDIKRQGELIALALDFWENNVLKDIPPQLTEDDVKIIEDNSDIKALCNEIVYIQETEPKNKKTIDNLKAVAIELAGHPKMKCGLVQISTVMRKGKFSFHKLTIGKGEK